MAFVSFSVLNKAFRLILKRNIYTTIVASKGHWNKDWKPGPFPKTPEERAAAAKRYGLRVEDYDVYPDDGVGFGDYPKLPMISAASKDPYEDWDMPHLKRNYCEPVHVDACLLHTIMEPESQTGVPLKTMLMIMFGFYGSILFLMWVSSPYPYFPPLMPKQYPFNNLYLENGGNPLQEDEINHYTFEPAS